MISAEKVNCTYFRVWMKYVIELFVLDFPLKYYLLRHIRASHLKTLSYKKKVEDHLPCCVCGKILKSKGNLSTHEKTHKTLTPEEYFYCDLCGNKFKSRGEMTVHIKKRHLFKIRYHCEICPPGKSWRTLFQVTATKVSNVKKIQLLIFSYNGMSKFTIKISANSSANGEFLILERPVI